MARARVAVWGGVAAAVLIAAAMAVPALTGWVVKVSTPPLHAEWMPRIGPGLPAAVALGALAVVFAPRLARRMRWVPLQATVFAAALAWLLSLALVDGLDGIGTILNHRYEYLGTAREVTDFGATLREYVDRIPYAHEDNWPVHIAGHPPGALLFFYLLVRIGLGSGLAAGFVVILVGATIPVAVLGAVRALGAELLARRAAPVLVFTPAAIWIGVSGDGMFTAFAAWGLWALARAATVRRRGGGVLAMTAWSVLAGLLLGYCVMLSYGLPLLGVLAVAVLAAGRSWWPIPIAAAAALLVVLLFAAGGFAWWEAFPVLQQRYWDGVASRRPPEYWMWGNLAAFAISAGPMVAASLAGAVDARFGPARRTLSAPERDAVRTIVLLVGAAWVSIALADLSQMSRAEVERIWLPFVPWALLGLALFAQRARRTMLAIQIALALLVQTLLNTGW
ncbi:hypothetical protein [Microbacterium sp. CIAB417]|uniref:hypothetical protein n=1 Tax=Microbacterium sp. CIAB417 TaxID=2860287 RepID=UPI001FAD93B6|nr:hypothetical protein [Microbacterium sp. CIAB417]